MTDKKLLTSAEAARLLGITDSQVRRLCTAGLLPGATRFGRSWAVPPSAVKHYQKHRPLPGYPKGRQRKGRLQQGG